MSKDLLRLVEDTYIRHPVEVLKEFELFDTLNALFV